MHPIVSVILCHHLPENRPYLDLAIKGVLSSVDVDLELLIGSSYPILDLPSDPRIRPILGDDLSNATKKIYAGVEQMHPESKYLLFLSDDVFISKYLIKNQLSVLSHSDFILNPYSNGEMGTRLVGNVDVAPDKPLISPLRLRPNLTIEDVKGFENSISECQGIAQIMVWGEWVSFYCTMMSKETYLKVGPLDPALDIRHNDQDYCYRARALNIHSLVNLGAFAIHFGSKTLAKCHSKEEMDEASEIFARKIGGVRVV